MKLIECYISSFGNLRDFSYDFTGALNTVKEDNGWGKSTFASFIKAMFYGLTGSKHAIENNERKRFAPWNSTEKFGGNLTFEWKGQRFKVERFFGAKASDDTVKLYDLATNKEYTEGAAVENIGKRVFSIDEEGFLSTTYFSQKDFEIKSNTSITAKFNEVCEIQDSTAFDRAVEELGDKIKELKSSRGDKGKIAEIKRAITAVNDETERTKQSLKTTEDLKKSLELVKEEIDNLAANMKELTVKLEIAGKREAAAERKKRYDALKAEIANLTAQKVGADAVLKGKTVTTMQIEDCEKCLSDLKDVTVKAEAAKADLAEYDAVRSDEKTKKPYKPYIVAIIAVLAVVIAVAAIVVMGKLWGAIIGAGVIIATITTAVLVFSKKKTADAVRGDAKLLEIYERKKRSVLEYENSIRELSSGLDGYFSAFDFKGEELSFQQKINTLKGAVKTSDELKAAIAKRTAELKEIEDVGAETEIKGGESVSELKDKLGTETEWYRQKVGEAERIRMRINALETAADSLTDCENKKAELTELLRESERELKILTLTYDFMVKADERLKIRYRAPLQESLNKYLRLIAGNGITASIDTDMKVSVNALGAERDTEFFSKGYRNLFEICKRFALTDILFTEEKPFIILDDPFSDLDDEKLAEALSLVKKLADEYQILYFVCHESRRA